MGSLDYVDDNLRIQLFGNSHIEMKLQFAAAQVSQKEKIELELILITNR